MSENNNGNGSLPSSIIREFQKLIGDCPREFGARQRVLSEIRGNFVFLEIRSTFKIPAVPSDSGEILSFTQQG